MDKATESFLTDLDSFFYGGNRWQAGLFQLVSDLDFKQASWKPSEKRNSIWKIIMHVNFWKYSVLSFTSGNPLSAEVRQNGDWRDIPGIPDEKLWKEELELLKNTHEEFKSLIKNMGSKLFDNGNEDSDYIRGIMNHDSYHAGQIGLLRILQGIKPIQY